MKVRNRERELEESSVNVIKFMEKKEGKVKSE